MEKLLTEVAMYANRRIALQVVTEAGEPWSMLSVNLPNVSLEVHEFCVPAWQLAAEEMQLQLASGRFEDTGKIEAAGRLQAPVWRVVDPQLLTAFAALQASS